VKAACPDALLPSFSNHILVQIGTAANPRDLTVTVLTATSLLPAVKSTFAN
jgi:hypothetical protein